MNKVVAHLRNGRIVKGTSLDVAPNRPTCHIRPAGGQAEEVKLRDLKALFFVRTLEGDAARDEERALDPEDRRAVGSTPVKLRFSDGEEMIGLTNRFPPNQPFFFIVPVDSGSNNVRILINRDAVVGMEALADG